jgi:hypothetical protein
MEDGDSFDEDIDNYTDRLPDPLTITLTTSPDTSTTTTTTTLATGELARKRRTREKKAVPSKQRILRVQRRLEKLASKQSEILTTLGSLCNQVESYNARKQHDGDSGTADGDDANSEEDTAEKTEEPEVTQAAKSVSWRTREQQRPSPEEIDDVEFTKIKVKMPHDV